jgi:TP901 family phage tail tape measure protein
MPTVGRFAIFSEFIGIDKITKPINKMQSRIKKFSRSVKTNFAGIIGTFRTMGKVAKRTLALGAVGGVFALQRAMRSTINVAASFEQSLVNAAARFGDGIQKGTKLFDRLKKAAREVGRTTEFTATQAAQGLNFFARAGVDAEQAMVALPKIIDLATAAEMDFAQAASIAVESVNALGKASDDSVTFGKNLNQVIDMINKTANSTTSTLDVLFEAITEGGPAVVAAEIPLRDFFKSLGVMSSKSLKGQRAGRAYRNMILSLASPTEEATRVMRRMGFKAIDPVTKGFRDFESIVVNLRESLSKLGPAQRLAALDAIFQKRQVTAISGLVAAGAEGLEKYGRSFDKAGDSTRRMANVMRDTLSKRFTMLSAALESLQLTIFDLEDEAFNRLVDGATKVVRKFELLIKGNKDFSKSVVGDIIDTVTGAIGSLMLFTAAFVSMEIAIKAATLAMIAFKVSLFFLKGIPLIAGIVLGFLKKLRIALLFISSVAFLIFESNPIGWLITGIAALAVAGVLLWKNWDKVKLKFRQLWNSITSTAKNGLEKIKSLFGSFSEKFNIVLDVITLPVEKLISGVTGLASKLRQVIGFVQEDEEDESVANRLGAQGRFTLGREERTSRQIEERMSINRAELTIKGDTERFTLSGGLGPNFGLKIQDSGAF